LWLGEFLDGWGATAPLKTWQAGLDGAGLPAGITVYRHPCANNADDATCTAAVGSGSGSGCNEAPIIDCSTVPLNSTFCDTCAPGFQDFSRADDLLMSIAACAIGNDNIGCGQTLLPAESPVADPAGKSYGATLVLAAATTLVGGPHTVDFIPPDGATFMTGSADTNGDGVLDDVPITVKVSPATVTIETGSCCFGIGTPGSGCVDGVSRTACGTLAAATNFRPAPSVCPPAGPSCAECGLQGLPPCADAVSGVTANNRCTTDVCNSTTLLCEFAPVPTWDRATECCDPGSGTEADREDDDDCTDDVCTRDGTSFGRPVIGPPSRLGVPDHPVSAAGTGCDDGNACTYGDDCDGISSTADGGCDGTDINLEDCNSDGECDALITGVVCDLDDKKCFCTLEPDVTVEIEDPKKGKHALCDGGIRDGEKCVTDQDCPGRVNPPVNPGFCDDRACFHEKEKVTATVHVAATTAAINGYQLLIGYDPACLDFVSFTSLPPWLQVLAQDVDEGAGEIFVAAGVDFGAGDGPFGNADLLSINFLKIGDCASCKICPIIGANPVNTYLVDNTGQPINIRPFCSQTVTTNGELTLNIPDSVKVNVGCDSVRQTVTWDPPSASDTCGLQDFVCQGRHEGDKDLSDRVTSGGVFPRGSATFCCHATNDCNHQAGFLPAHKLPPGEQKNPFDQAAIAEGCWTVTVNDQTVLDLVIELSPTMESKPEDGLIRCIEFEMYGNCVQSPTVWCDDIEFGGIWNLTGHSVDTLKSPSGQFACVTARDKLHTLRSCALRADGNLACTGGVLFATFKGDPFFGGNWLIGGNLDAWKKDNPKASHDVIDILDFGQFVAQYLRTYDSDGDQVPDGNTPCRGGTTHKDFDCHAIDSAHADINGDGIADLLDFTFVSMNFLESSKDCCCPGSVGNTRGRTEIAVTELRQSGLSDLVVADLNGDGMVNMDDMAEFLSGNVPARKPAHSGIRSSGRK
jgi:hypothetical protein